MIDRGRGNVLGVEVDAVDLEAATERILDAARRGRPLGATALAVHGVMTGVLDAEQRWRLNHLDLAVPDGQPVRWALNLLAGKRLAERVYGPDLMLAVCGRAAAEELPIYFYGSRPEVLADLEARLVARFPGLRVAGREPSRFRREPPAVQREIAERIRASGAAVTFVGLGCPRQEVWVYEHRELIPMPLVAVGAAFDFHAGRMPQAPPALQRAGLEWLYRLGREPARLWRRYLLLNPLYLALVALQASRLRRFDPGSARPPRREIGYA